MFKTVDGELKVFNKTILSTQNNLKNLQTQTANLSYYTSGGNHVNLQNVPIAQPQTVSNFTKLNNAFNVYNSNLTKSTGLQNAYIKSVGTQNQALGNYLAGLKGAPATFSGYITFLTKAKLATIGLQAASVALNVALTMGAVAIVSTVIKAFTHLYNISDKLAEKTEELASSLKSQTDEYNNLKSELDEVNKKLKDNESRYSELIEKQKESGLTTEESGELEELQRITGELTNQKNILEENIRLKKESAAATGQELADTLLRQQDVLNFFDEWGGKIEAVKDTFLSFMSQIPLIKNLKTVGNVADFLTTIANALDLSNDHWFVKLVNMLNGTSMGSFVTGTDLTKDPYEETVANYEAAQKQMKAIRDKYDKNGDGIIDSDATMTEEDSNAYRRYYDKSVEYANQLKADYQELDDAIKALEGDPNLSQVNKEELERLKAARDIIADILGYNNEGKTGNGVISDKDVENANKMTASLSDLNSISDGFSTLSKAMEEMDSEGLVTIDTISEINEKFANVKGIDGYVETLLSAKKGSKEFQDALDGLTYGLIDSTYSTEELANANVEHIARMLEAAGVSNSLEVATWAVARAKEEARAKTYGAALAAGDSVNALADEADQAGMTEDAFHNLVLEVGIFNNTSLDVSGKIAALQELGYFADLTAEKIANATMKRVEANGTTAVGIYDESGKLIRVEKVGRDTSSSQNTAPTARYTSPTASKTADRAADSAEKMAEAAETLAEKEADIAERLADAEEDFAEKMAEWEENNRIETFKEELQKRQDALDKYDKYIDTLDFGLDLIDEENFDGQTQLLYSKLAGIRTQTTQLKNEFSYLLSLNPQSGEEAQAVADMITGVGEQLKENLQLIKETQREFMTSSIDSLTSYGSMQIDALEYEIERVQSLINIFENQNANDYGKYSKDLLFVDAFFNSMSIGESEAVKEQAEEDAEMIELTQETQDTINDIVTDALNKQIEDNREAREEERQQLIEDFEETKQDLMEELEEARKEYNDKIGEIRDDTSEIVTEIRDDTAEKTGQIRDDTNEKLVNMEDQTESSTNSMQTSFGDAVTSMQASADSFSAQNIISQLERITQAANQIPRNIEINVSTNGDISMPGSNRGSTPNEQWQQASKDGRTGSPSDITIGASSDGKYPVAPGSNVYISDTYEGHLARGSAGIDIAAPYGAPVRAVRGGTVVAKTYDSRSGYHVIVRDSDGVDHGYMHMSQDIPVNYGDSISEGDVLGYVSSTGNARGPHLHYQTKIGGRHINPREYIGNAYADGWEMPTKNSAWAVVGEEGYELVITPGKDGVPAKVFVVGAEGAEMKYIPEGSIILDHEESKAVIEGRRTLGDNELYYVDDDKTQYVTNKGEYKPFKGYMNSSGEMFHYRELDIPSFVNVLSDEEAAEIDDLVYRAENLEPGAWTELYTKYDPKKLYFDKEGFRSLVGNRPSIVPGMGITYSDDIIWEIEQRGLDKTEDDSNSKKEIIRFELETVNDLDTVHKGVEWAIPDPQTDDIMFKGGENWDAEKQSQDLHGFELVVIRGGVKQEDGTYSPMRYWIAGDPEAPDVSDLPYASDHEGSWWSRPSDQPVKFSHANSVKFLSYLAYMADEGIMAGPQSATWGFDITNIKGSKEGDGGFSPFDETYGETTKEQIDKMYIGSEEYKDVLLEYLQTRLFAGLGNSFLDTSIVDEELAEALGLKHLIHNEDGLSDSENGEDDPLTDWLEIIKSLRAPFDDEVSVIMSEYRTKLLELHQRKDEMTEEEQLIALKELETGLYNALGEVGNRGSNVIYEAFLEWDEMVKAGLIEDSVEVREAWVEAFSDFLEHAKDADEYLNDTFLKDVEDTLSEVDRIASRVIKSIEEEIEGLEKDILRRNSLISIEQGYYESSNLLSDAQHEADKAIAQTRIGAKYLSDDEYEGIYSEEDYEKQSTAISSIRNSINEISEQFYRDIENLGDDQLYLAEAMTEEYHRQVEDKERELEIVKAEIDLQNKQNQLNNILSERNVLMLKDGHWQWTFNYDRAKAAQDAVSDATYVYNRAKENDRQQDALDVSERYISDKTKEIGGKNLQISSLQESIDALDLAVEDAIDPIGDIRTYAEIFAKYGIGELNTALNGFLTMLSKITGENYGYINPANYVDYMGKRWYDDSQGYQTIIDKGMTRKYVKIGDVKYYEDGLDANGKSVNEEYNKAVYKDLVAKGAEVYQDAVPGEGSLYDKEYVNNPDEVIFDPKSGKTTFKKGNKYYSFVGNHTKGYNAETGKKLVEYNPEKRNYVQIGKQKYYADGSEFEQAVFYDAVTKQGLEIFHEDFPKDRSSIPHITGEGVLIPYSGDIINGKDLHIDNISLLSDVIKNMGITPDLLANKSREELGQTFNFHGGINIYEPADFNGFMIELTSKAGAQAAITNRTN